MDYSSRIIQIKISKQSKFHEQSEVFTKAFTKVFAVLSAFSMSLRKFFEVSKTFSQRHFQMSLTLN